MVDHHARQGFHRQLVISAVSGVVYRVKHTYPGLTPLISATHTSWEQVREAPLKALLAHSGHWVGSLEFVPALSIHQGAALLSLQLASPLCGSTLRLSRACRVLCPRRVHLLLPCAIPRQRFPGLSPAAGCCQGQSVFSPCARQGSVPPWGSLTPPFQPVPLPSAH